MPTPLASTVLFDLDGTLTDSAPGILAGYRHALATVGVAVPDGRLDVVGPPMIDNFRAMGMSDDQVQQAITAYFDSYDHGGGWAKNEVFDGIEPVLRSLVDAEVRLGVATSKSERLAQRILRHFQLDDYFGFIGGASADLGRRRKADVIAHTLTELGVLPTPHATVDVVMIGDRDHDVHGADEWGIPTIFVEWGYGSDAEAAGARWRAGSPAELATILRV